MSEKLLIESAFATLQTSMNIIITHPALNPLKDTNSSPAGEYRKMPAG